MEKEQANRQGVQGRRSGRVVNLLAAVVLLLLLASGVLVFMYVRQSKESAKVEQILESERDSLEGNLKRVVEDFGMLKTDNAALQEKLDGERERAQELLNEVRRVKQVSYGKIKEYQRELGTLRAIMRKMVGEIDSLNTLNKNLVEENVKVRTEYQESQRSIDKLTEERAELAARVDKGAALRAKGVMLVGLSKKDKETTRAKRVRKLRTCFTLMENVIAEAGVKQLYVRIFGPDGALLANAEGATFLVDGEQLTFSAVRDVDYQNDDTEVCIFYGEGESFVKGVYRVEIYGGGVLIGQGEATLR